mmetsp:Transcript_25166/g.51149  ORF Transcript_25166/g.51149 Transcript_25166/m.51149 type:complete len:266 (-) Transcript_25166:162-959(-)
MAVVGYGTLPAGERQPAGRVHSRHFSAAALTMAAVAVLLVLACAFTIRAPQQTSLLGYDPFGSVANPGHSEINDDFDDENTEQLPGWATDWDEGHARSDCEAGAECDDIPNPLGALGKWVMVKTAPHFNTEKDRHERHSCNGLPGWALEECMKVREHEAKLDDAGQEKPATEEEEEAAAESGEEFVCVGEPTEAKEEEEEGQEEQAKGKSAAGEDAAVWGEYDEAIVQLVGMGLCPDGPTPELIALLAACNGDVSRAVDRILASV